MSPTHPNLSSSSANQPPPKPIEEPLRQALEESDERFRATFEQAAVGIAHVAPDGNWLRLNQKLCDILGYTVEELTRRTFQDITHPDDLESDLAQVKQVLAKELSSYSMEKRYFHKDGSIIWVNLTVSLVREVSGEPKYFISVIQDISARKQVEAKFRASEQRFRRAIVNAPLPIAIYNDSGEMLHLSKGWTQITGYSADEISTIESWTEQAYGEDKDLVTEKIYQLFDREPPLVEKTEGLIQTKSGEKRTWQFHSMPLGKLDSGQKLAMGIAADITELQSAQTELARKLQQQAVIAQLGQLALMNHDLQQLFDLATGAIAQSLDVEYCKVLELSADRTQLKLVSGVGWSPKMIGNAVVDNNLASQAGYTLISKRPVVVEDLRTESRFSGPPLLTDYGITSGISTIIYQQENVIFGILGAHTVHSRSFSQADVDFVQAIANILSSSIERHRADKNIKQLNRELEARVAKRTAQLEASNEELKAFTYTVSHDLRAPLRAMEGFAQALREDYAPLLDELGHEYAHRIASAARQMDGLISDLLTYSQLSRTDIRIEPVLIENAIEVSMAAVEPLRKQRQATITVDQMYPICGNYSILVRVFTNLLSNAIKFVPEDRKPVVRVTCEQMTSHSEDSAGTVVRIRVKDNGIGIAPIHQQRIFNVFERLHGVESYPGSGIGLAIVKKGVARMGGKMGLQSELGTGSEFWIELKGQDQCLAKPLSNQ